LGIENANSAPAGELRRVWLDEPSVVTWNSGTGRGEKGREEEREKVGM